MSGASRQGLAAVPDLSVREALAGKRILLTGATGFVGKVALSMLLTRFPEVGKVYVMARPGVSTSAEARFFGKVVVAPPFDPLRAKLGGGFDAFVRETCEAVSGDVSRTWCGISEEVLERLEGGVDLIINSAGLVDFAPSLEAGLNANATGAVNVARTAARLGAKLVHVSTCFVAGERPGYVMEEEALQGYFPKREERPDESFDPFAEIEDCRASIDRLKAQADDKALLSEFRAKAAARLREEGRDPRDARALRIGAMRERKLWLSEALIRAGMDRSRYWGWPNTYCYTKSLGDQVIDAIAEETGLAFSIARPAIVESALQFPFPGWNEGFTTTAPLTFLAMKGHRNFAARKGLTLDVVPVDLIAAGVIAAGGALLAGKGRKVYHLGTSDQNPLAVDRALELTGLYRRRYYRRKAEEGEKLKNEILARMEPQTVPQETFQKLSAPQVAKLAKVASGLLEEWKPSWGAPRIGATIERVQDRLEVASRQAEMAAQLFEIFIPFVWENDYVFSTKNIGELYARMDPEDARKIPWDPAGLDWLHYWLDIHMPGLEKWVYPNLEDELGARARKKGAPVYRDLWSLLEARAQKHPGKVAMRHFARGGGSVRYTYGQLRDRAMRASLYLAACGIEAGDRVVLLSENRPEWAMAYFGVIRAGATVVPVDAEASLEEVENIVASAGAKGVVASDVVYRRLLRAGRAPAPAIRLDDLFQGAVRMDEAGAFTPREPAELASIIFTSGTTGAPKGVMLSGKNFTSLVSKLSEIFDLGERDGLLSVLPLHHTFEFTTGLLLPLAVGAEIAYLEERKGESILEAFETGRITAMVGVPAVWKLLLKRIEEGFERLGIARAAQLLQEGGRRLHDATGARWPSRAAFLPVHRKFGGRLRYLISGGSAMPPKIYDAFRGMGFEILEGYGLTEAAPVLTVQRPGEGRAGHVGRAIGGVEVRIHRPGADGVGEIVAKGPNVMLGYWNDPEATAATIRDGWLHTGDLGRLDDEGNLIIAGRSKEVIVDAAGKNIYPDELEALYEKHPSIKELSIVGLPTEGGGERVACLVVPAEAPGGADEARRAIEGHFREVSLRLPIWKRVKLLHFQDEALPRTATQKVRRAEVVRALEALERGRARRKAGAVGREAWLYDLISRVCEQPLEKVVPDAKLEQDLGFDSLTFTELGAALEAAGVELPTPEEILALETVEELVRLVGRKRRGGRKTRHAGEDAGEAGPPTGRKLKTLLGSALDLVQPAADRLPLLSSALTLAREEGLELLDDYFSRPKTREEGENQPFDLPDFVVSTGKSVLRGGQIGLYENLFHTRLYGRAHIPPHTNFLVAANHASHLDMGLVKHALGEQGGNLAALAARDYFFKDRLRRTYFENFTQLIPMDRHGSLRESLELASRTLKKGNNLLIFPEGTRAQDGEIKEFKGSLGYLALTNRAGILPMYLEGTFEALPKGRLVPKSRELAVHIAPFLSFETLEAVVEGLPRSEQHRAVARLVEAIIRALRDGTPLPPLPGTPPRGKAPSPRSEAEEDVERPRRRATPGESKG